MKKHFFLFSATFLAAMTLSACNEEDNGNGGGTVAPRDIVESIKISGYELNLVYDDQDRVSTIKTSNSEFKLTYAVNKLLFDAKWQYDGDDYAYVSEVPIGRNGMASAIPDLLDDDYGMGPHKINSSLNYSGTKLSKVETYRYYNDTHLRTDTLSYSWNKDVLARITRSYYYEPYDDIVTVTEYIDIEYNDIKNNLNIDFYAIAVPVMEIASYTESLSPIQMLGFAGDRSKYLVSKMTYKYYDQMVGEYYTIPYSYDYTFDDQGRVIKIIESHPFEYSIDSVVYEITYK